MFTFRKQVSAIVVCVCVAVVTWSAPAARADFEQVTKLFPSDVTFLSLFGTGVSISGEVAIGGGIGGNGGKGSVAVFEPVSGVWQQTALLTASDAANGDAFGVYVSIDGERVAVGAMQDDDAGADSGSAYVFDRVAGTWQQTAKLTASDAAAGDGFGRAISLDGERIVVGSPYDDDDGTSSGSAYVFELVNGSWQEVAKLTASDAASNGSFGWNVSLDGQRIVIGAPDVGAAGTGAAYVFELAGGLWQEVTKLTASDAAAEDGFGWSVSVRGDYILCGSPMDDDTYSKTGSAYVFELVSGSWQETKLNAADPGFEDQFGYSVAIANGVALIGANYEDALGFTSGATYVFVEDGGAWAQQDKLRASDGAADAQFGCSVALSGNRAAIGALGDHRGAFFGGAMYVFEAPPSTGDMNCDGFVNNADIPAFVLALIDPAGYTAAYPDCDPMLGDVDGDGEFNNADIPAFVALLTGE